MSEPVVHAEVPPQYTEQVATHPQTVPVPTLETPEGVWSPERESPSPGDTGETSTSFYDVVRRASDAGHHQGQPLMRLQNRSTPSLPSHMEHQQQQQRPPLPGQDPSELNFAGLNIADPIPRAGSQNSYRPGDSYRNMSGPSQRRMGPPPARHPGTLPPSGWNRVPPPGSFDGSSVYSGRSSGYDSSSQSHENDRASTYSNDSQRRPPPPNGYMRGPPGGPPPQGYPGYPPPQGYPATGPGWHPPPPQQQYPQQYNPLYAAASDVLGLGPPPGQPPYSGPSEAPIPQSMSAPYLPPPPPNGSQYPPPNGSQYLPPNGSQYSLPPPQQGGLSPYPMGGPGLNRGVSSASSLAPPGNRPGLQRAPTTVSNLSSLNTRKSKAIDVNAQPYTKEYVEEYRTRIKADPDPEAHFAFAKYLIEAAKKIGADATDQRAVKKYRDTLVVESLKVIRRLATQGETYAEAQFFLANCHGTGMLGLTVDHERAYHLYLQAAKQNHPAACYRVAVCNDIGAGTKKEPARAFTFYRKAASLGDTAAMYKLGTILLRGGLGQPPNPREAVQWLKRAAEQADEENPHALYTLATLHERLDNEGGVIHDEVYSLELYIRAGQLGHVPSQLKLGSCYESGSLGCPMEPRKSIAWYTKAAEKGDPEAELSLSGWYLTGSEGILKQSDSEAYLWARRSANKGWPRAEYAVGYYAEVGIGVQQDMELAKRWYMRAAAQGNKRAMARLTELKRLGNKRTAAARPTRQQAGDENCVIM